MKRTLFAWLTMAIMMTACQQGQESNMETDVTEIATVNSNTENSIGMIQHTVYFYLNEDVTEEEQQQFEEGLEALSTIEEIYKSEIGVPADTPEREVTDNTFGYSLYTWFETMEDYNVYAKHPDHLEFIDRYEGLWANVKVYDSDIIQ